MPSVLPTKSNSSCISASADTFRKIPGRGLSGDLSLGFHQFPTEERIAGIDGFGVSSLKNMRISYEAWTPVTPESPTAAGDFQITDNDLVAILQPELPNSSGFPLDEFLRSFWRWANFLLKCFVLMNMKTTKATCQDADQMDMHAKMYDERFRSGGDNPT